MPLSVSLSESLNFGSDRFHLGCHQDMAGLLVFGTKRQLVTILEDTDFFKIAVSLLKGVFPNPVVNQDVIFISIRDLVSVAFSRNPFQIVKRDQVVFYGQSTHQPTNVLSVTPLQPSLPPKPLPQQQSIAIETIDLTIVRRKSTSAIQLSNILAPEKKRSVRVSEAKLEESSSSYTFHFIEAEVSVTTKAEMLSNVADAKSTSSAKSFPPRRIESKSRRSSIPFIDPDATSSSAASSTSLAAVVNTQVSIHDAEETSIARLCEKAAGEAKKLASFYNTRKHLGVS